jgi:hypothetical protein
MEWDGKPGRVTLTRSRGGAEEEAEKRQHKREGRRGIRALAGVAERAENAEERSPSFARMDKADPYPTGHGEGVDFRRA